MKIGLVFSGGGGKGSYEIGAWKAFEQFNVKFDVISGTSIGALNGLLITMADIKTAEQIWLNFEDYFGKSIEQQTVQLTEEHIACMDVAFQDHTIIHTLAEQKGVMSQDTLKRVMNQLVSDEKIKNMKQHFYVCSVPAIKNPTPKYFKINAYKEDEVKKMILSSTALPVIFDAVEIEGVKYFDGGLMDVAPITPVYEENCDLIFVIYLGQEEKIVLQRFAYTPIIPIIPSKPLGGFNKGTMDYTKEGAKWRMELGYQDTCRLLTALRQI